MFWLHSILADALKEYNTTGPPEKTKPFPDTHQSLNQNQESLTQEPEVSNSRETGIHEVLAIKIFMVVAVNIIKI